MISHIDTNSSVAVYLQIENHVKFAIASGRLEAGDQLPSVRELSDRLDINPNTVAKAYRDLEITGLVYTRRGTGVYVNKGADAKCRESCRRDIVNRLHEVVAEAKASGMDIGEIVDIAGLSYKHDGAPYSPLPSELLSRLKPKRA